MRFAFCVYLSESQKMSYIRITALAAFSSARLRTREMLTRNPPPTEVPSSQLPGLLQSRHLLIERQDVRERADRRDGEGVDLLVRAGVVVLDVQEVGRVLEGRVVPVQVPHPRVQVWVAGPNVFDVALEVLDVDGLYHMC